MAAFTDRTATVAAECPRPSWTACSRDLYGFRTSLTVRHRDMVDRQPVPATVSRCRNQEPSESDSDIAARVTAEIRLRAVTEVNDGAPVGEVAERYGVSRQTVTAWRKRYEAGGLDALADQSRRPHVSPGRIAPDVEALICETRRHHRRWGADGSPTK